MTTDLTGSGPFDLIVVGSGIAGLSAALSALELAGDHHVRVAAVTKGSLADGCSRWAQGGLAAAIGPDDAPLLHLQDTVNAGRGLCDVAAVRVLVEDAPAAVERLQRWGVRFDTGPDGALLLGQEAAHSRRRIVHAGGDATGAVIEAALIARLRSSGATILENTELIELLVVDGARCCGVVVGDPDGGALRTITGNAVLLATGGAARLWLHSTNPAGATGQGIGIAYTAGAEVAGMEFVQFHPTALAVPGAPHHLLSEAMRGEGAQVVNNAGDRFLFDADPRGELAPRDTVAQAIVAELARSGEPHAWLDARPLGEAGPARFPSIAALCREVGVDIVRDRIPVVPAAHYLIGGVRTDIDGATSLAGLYAAGEVASSGVHGANRLASNSLLEGAVFGRRAAVAALGRHGEHPPPPPPPAAAGAQSPASPPGSRTDAAEPVARLREAMWSGAGIVRDQQSLAEAEAVAVSVLERAEAAGRGRGGVHAAAVCAALVCRAATLRCESRGAHLRSDHPTSTDDWLGQLVIHHDRGARLDRHA